MKTVPRVQQKKIYRETGPQPTPSLPARVPKRPARLPYTAAAANDRNK
jgi:hypothetical protein